MFKDIVILLQKLTVLCSGGIRSRAVQNVHAIREGKLQMLRFFGLSQKRHQKTTIFFMVFLCHYLCQDVMAIEVRDLNLNSTIDIPEAIYSLQVAQGAYQQLDSSCQLTGKGEWQADTLYSVCDVVEQGNKLHACNLSHTSSTTFQNDNAYWTVLVLPDDWQHDGANMNYPSGNAGIGTTVAPEAKLEVEGAAKVTLSSVVCDQTSLGTIQYQPALGGFVGCIQAPGLDEGEVFYTWMQLTELVPTVVSAERKWMDRNLGAARRATSLTDEKAHGYLYQWGRLADGHQNRYEKDGSEIETTDELSNQDQPGHSQFITTSSTPDDWRSPQNELLWQGLTGVNNPCPAGFRLPTKEEFNTEKASWITKNEAGAFASPLKLTLGGRRDENDGSIIKVGARGHYWTSTTDDSESKRFMFNATQTTFENAPRAKGFSVRCIQD